MKREREKVIDAIHFIFHTSFLGVTGQIRIRNGKVGEVPQTEKIVEDVKKYKLDLSKKRSVCKIQELILPTFSLYMKPWGRGR